jgi:hypothetical protein
MTFELPQEKYGELGRLQCAYPFPKSIRVLNAQGTWRSPNGTHYGPQSGFPIITCHPSPLKGHLLSTIWGMCCAVLWVEP